VLAPEWPVSRSALSRFGHYFADEEYIKDEGAYTVASAARPKAALGRVSTVNTPGDVDFGYTAEIRLPWGSIGAPVSARRWVELPSPDLEAPQRESRWEMEGEPLRLLAVFQNLDLRADQRYYHSSPTFMGGWFHQFVRDWPVYRCVTGASAAPVPEQARGAEHHDP
jgi:hypothetical protein